MSHPKTVPLAVLLNATRLAWIESPRDGMILEILQETAARSQEVRLLIVGDCWKSGDIVLSLALRPEIAKGGRGRMIPFTATFRSKMRNYIIEHRAGQWGPLEAEPLFPSRSGGGHLTRKAMCELVAKYFERAGHRATPHAIRHTAATELLRVSNARVVQMILGHRRLDTVQIYTHPSDEDLRAAVESRRRESPSLTSKTEPPAERVE